MQTLTFHGRVLPDVFDITVPNIPSVKWQTRSDPAFLATLRLTVEQSLVTVVCEMQADPADISALYIHAHDLAHAAVDLIAFKNGWPLKVVLNEFESGGVRSKFKAENKPLENVCTAFDLDRDFEVVRNIVIEDPVLSITLHDLIQVISTPHYAPIGCARVVEGIRNLIAPELPDKEAWEAMRAALNLDASYLKIITDASKDHRHGRRTRVEGDVTRTIAVGAWEVMNRYLEYRKRKGIKLPESEFAVLR